MSEENVQNIYQRVASVMADVGYIQKKREQGGLPYPVVGHDDVIAKLRPSILKNGIVTEVDVVEYGQDGNRTHVLVAVTFVNIDNPDDRFTCKGLGYGCGNDDKGPGKCISYAVKYVLLKVFCLETGTDADSEHVEYEPSTRQPREEPHEPGASKAQESAASKPPAAPPPPDQNAVKEVYNDILEHASSKGISKYDLNILLGIKAADAKFSNLPAEVGAGHWALVPMKLWNDWFNTREQWVKPLGKQEEK